MKCQVCRDANHTDAECWSTRVYNRSLPLLLPFGSHEESPFNKKGYAMSQEASACACIGPPGDCPCVRRAKGLPVTVSQVHISDDVFALLTPAEQRTIADIKLRALGRYLAGKKSETLGGPSSVLDPGPTGWTPDVKTIRAVLSLFEIDGSSEGWYYNEANDFGCVNLTLWTGRGSPDLKFFGPEKTREYINRDGTSEFRGTGTYPLNEEAVKLVLEKIQRENWRNHDHILP